MDVSVIITSYNYADYIEDALKSVIGQGLHNSDNEIIVVLRKSGDGTEDILKKYESLKNFRVIEQKGKGLSNASNEGIKAAKGKYILRLDADDVFYPGIITKEKDCLDRDAGIDFVYPDYIVNLLPSNEKIRKELPPFDEKELLARGDFLSGGTMYRKSVFDRIGLFDESLETLESYEFILRLIKNGIKGYHIPEALFEYRMHGKSMSDDRELIESTGRKIAAKYGMEYRANSNHPREY